VSLVELRITQDIAGEHCGACHRRVPPIKPGGPSFCGVFGVGLARTSSGDHVRVTGCLAAEQAARPWERAEDEEEARNEPEHIRRMARLPHEDRAEYIERLKAENWGPAK
jgi:hypothetical protein